MRGRGMGEAITAGEHAIGGGSGGEEVLGRWRELGKASTYFMAHVIGYRDRNFKALGELHSRMGRWIQGGSKRKLGLVPRDHLKTSLWTIADTVRIVTCDEHARVLIKNEVDDNASA